VLIQILQRGEGIMHFGILVVEGPCSLMASRLQGWFDKQVQEILAPSGETLTIINAGQHKEVERFDRWLCVVNCDGHVDREESSIHGAAIGLAKRTGVPIFPVVSDLTNFGDLAPPYLSTFNGFQHTLGEPLDELGNLLLENMELLPSKRKIFISYARHESRAIALQLQQRLAARWYQAFLDTHTIRPGTNFQETLMQELSDSDLVILLDSPDIKNRPWVLEEIAFADRACLGTLQVVWPGHRRTIGAGFSEPLFLQEYGETPFLNPEALPKDQCLRPKILDDIISLVAHQRASAFRNREARMVDSVVKSVQTLGWNAVKHSGRYLALTKNEKLIPMETVLGLPDALRIQHAVERHHGCHLEKLPLLYDSQAITNAMADHLSFLEEGLGNIALISPQEVSPWIGQI